MSGYISRAKLLFGRAANNDAWLLTAPSPGITTVFNKGLSMGNSGFGLRQWSCAQLRALICMIVLMCCAFLASPSFAQEAEPTPETPAAQNETPLTQEEASEQQEELDSRQQLIRSLLSLSETLETRKARLAELFIQLENTEEDTERPALEAEIEVLGKEIIQAGDEIEIVVLLSLIHI